MKHIIRTDFPRPAADVVQALAAQHVGVVGCEVGPRQVMHSTIKPLDPQWRVCGPAFTVRAEHWDDRLVGELAPKYVKPGDVIIVDAGGHTEVAVWGLSMTKSAKRAGAAGVVIDGSTMNSRLLVHERPQIPVFARGIAAIATTAEGRGSLNVPVVCGGVIVYPGDIILGDSDGVVVIKPDAAQHVVAACEGHDKRARAITDQSLSYFEERGSEQKLRAFADISWS